MPHFAALLPAMAMLASSPTCPSTLTAADLDSAIDRVTEAFRRRDIEAVQIQSEAIAAALPCVGEALTPAQAARWHAAQALVETSRLAPARAARELDAARRISPGEIPSPILDVPLLRERGMASDVAQHPTALVRIPDGQRLIVDGVPDAPLPRDLPAILQLGSADAQGMVTRTWTGHGPVRRWRGLFPAPEGRDAWMRRGLLGGGAGALALGAGLAYGIGLENLNTFNNSATPRAELLGLLDRSHRLSLAAAGLGLGAAGLGTAVVLTW